MNLLYPDTIVGSLKDIDLTYYWDLGKRGIILDIDNTITPWHQDTIAEGARIFIEEALRMPFQVCLLSNATYKRSAKIARQYNIPYVAMALKPRKKSFKQALGNMKLSAGQVIVIGDQLFTDIWGGNRTGCYTILVTPLDKKEFIWTQMMRGLESLLLRRRK